MRLNRFNQQQIERNKTMTSLFIFALLAFALVAAALIIGSFSKREGVWNGYDHTPHENGHIGRTAEAAFPARYLLFKAGAAAGGMDICGATDEPLGTCMDSPALGERATCLHFGATKGTKTVIASKVLAADVRVYSAAGGKVTDVAVSGSYLVGRTVEAAAGDDSPVEIVPCFPVVQP